MGSIRLLADQHDRINVFHVFYRVDLYFKLNVILVIYLVRLHQAFPEQGIVQA